MAKMFYPPTVGGYVLRNNASTKPSLLVNKKGKLIQNQYMPLIYLADYLLPAVGCYCNPSWAQGADKYHLYKNSWLSEKIEGGDMESASRALQAVREIAAGTYNGFDSPEWIAAMNKNTVLPKTIGPENARSLGPCGTTYQEGCGYHVTSCGMHGDTATLYDGDNSTKVWLQCETNGNAFSIGVSTETYTPYWFCAVGCEEGCRITATIRVSAYFKRLINIETPKAYDDNGFVEEWEETKFRGESFTVSPIIRLYTLDRNWDNTFWEPVDDGYGGTMWPEAVRHEDLDKPVPITLTLDDSVENNDNAYFKGEETVNFTFSNPKSRLFAFLVLPPNYGADIIKTAFGTGDEIPDMSVFRTTHNSDTADIIFSSGGVVSFSPTNVGTRS